MFVARRVNDRVIMDVLYIHDISNVSHWFLSLVDDATAYHVLFPHREAGPRRLARRIRVHVVCRHVVQDANRAERRPSASGEGRTTRMGRNMDHGEVDRRVPPTSQRSLT